jgi:nucleoside-diphosphate-sugar epimerase
VAADAGGVVVAAKDVLIIGATGALGYSTTLAALSAGHRVRVLARNPSSPLIPAGVDVVKGTAESVEDLRRATAGCEAVFYCLNVPITEWESRMETLLANALVACREEGARLAFPGNVWVFGKGGPGEKVGESRPLTPISKKGRLRARLERMLEASGARYTVVRLPEFYGPAVTNPLMGAPFEAALAGRSINWLGGHLDVKVEYVYMPDAAKAEVEAGTAEGVDGETFHVPGCCETTPREFWGEVARDAGAGARVRVVPTWALKALGLFKSDAREFADVLHLWSDPVLLDGAKYEARFGRVPRTPYAEGIRETLAWYAGHRPSKAAA